MLLYVSAYSLADLKFAERFIPMRGKQASNPRRSILLIL
jgi:hypothetical protein